MARFKCAECGTRRVFTEDLAGRRVACPNCGVIARLIDENETSDAIDQTSELSVSGRRKKRTANDSRVGDDADDERPSSRSVPKTKKSGTPEKRVSSDRKSGGAGLVTLRVFGYLAAAHGALSLVMTLLAMPVLFFLFPATRTLIVVAVLLVFLILVGIGVKGAIGWGIGLARKNGLEGAAGIAIGIVLIEGTIFGSMFFFHSAFDPAGKNSLFAFTALPNANPQGPPNTNTPATIVTKDSGPERYVDSDRGFSLVPPDGWTVKEDDDVGNRSFLGPVSNGIQTTMSIQVESFESPLLEWTDIKLGQVKYVYPNARDMSRSYFQSTIGDRGIKIIMEAEIDKRKFRLLIYSIEKVNATDDGNRKLLIIAAVPLETIALDSDLDACSRSVQFHSQEVQAETKTKDPFSALMVQPHFPDMPRVPEKTMRVFRYSTTVKEFNGSGNIVTAAKRALRSIPSIEQESIQYDVTTKILRMHVSSRLSPTPISNALSNAGIHTGGFRINSGD